MCTIFIGMFTLFIKERPKIFILGLTGDERIELPLKVLETSVIPFDQSPIKGLHLQNYIHATSFENLL